MGHDDHYLKRELYERVRSDPALFEFLQAGSLDGIWFWDLENPEHEWMSPRFWQVFGHDPREKQHLASEWQDMIDGDDLKVALDNFEKHCANPEHPYDQYVRYRHKDGSTVWVRCRGIAIRDDSGKPIRLLGAHTDVTLLKRAEEEIRRLATELEQANRELEAFSYSVSHDLKAPLRAIDGYARLLVEEHSEQLDEEGLRFLEVIGKSTEKMARLIDDLLAFARVSRRSLEPRRIDMTTLVRAAFEEIRGLEPTRNVELQLDELPSAVVDPGLLHQVWVNLLDNAIKYTRTRAVATIEVTGSVQGEETVFTVRDNGVGFDMRYGDKLFGVFQRLHKESEFEGTGVGLALVSRIIERHGGRVWGEGAVGEGAMFTFTLPKKAP